MRISDWSSDVCSSDLGRLLAEVGHPVAGVHDRSAHTGRCRFLLTRRLLLGCAAAGHGLDAAEVEAGAEAPALSRQHHGAHTRVGLEGPAGPAHRRAHGEVAGRYRVRPVQALLLAVDLYGDVDAHS